MTVQQLERAVCALGFVASVEDARPLLLEAAARGLQELAVACPRIGSATLWHLPSPPLYSEGSIERLTGEKTFSLPSGASYLLRLAGRGEVVFSRGGESLALPFSSREGEEPALLGGTIPGKNGAFTVRIRAEGGWRLLTLAIYDTVFPTLPPDPFGRRRYELSELIPDFGALVLCPEDENGRALVEGPSADYTLEDGHILSLPPHTAGKILLRYRRRLTLSEAGELPISEEESALLPLFCASYLLLEDEPEKASFYLSRFHEGLLGLQASKLSPTPFRDVNRWG